MNNQTNPIDTSKLDKRFDELSKPEKLALCEAIIDGKTIECYDGVNERWIINPDPKFAIIFHDQVKYRTAPSPEVIDGEWYSVEVSGALFIARLIKNGETIIGTSGTHTFTCNGGDVKIIKHLANPFVSDN